MRQSGSVPHACTSHCPGLNPVIPLRTIFWYFPRATQSGGQGKVKVCPSGELVWAPDGSGAPPMIRRRNNETGTSPRTLSTLGAVMVAPSRGGDHSPRARPVRAVFKGRAGGTRPGIAGRAAVSGHRRRVAGLLAFLVFFYTCRMVDQALACAGRAERGRP